MSGYIRGTVGILAFLGLMGCGNGRLIDLVLGTGFALVLGTGFALVLWVCARPRRQRGRQTHNQSIPKSGITES